MNTVASGKVDPNTAARTQFLTYLNSRYQNIVNTQLEGRAQKNLSQLTSSQTNEAIVSTLTQVAKELPDEYNALKQKNIPGAFDKWDRQLGILPQRTIKGELNDRTSVSPKAPSASKFQDGQRVLYNGSWGVIKTENGAQRWVPEQS